MPGEQRGQESVGGRESGGLWRIKRMKALVSSFIRSCTCTCKACVLAAPTEPLHRTVALESGGEARYVRR